MVPTSLEFKPDHNERVCTNYKGNCLFGQSQRREVYDRGKSLRGMLCNNRNIDGYM